MYNVFTTLAEIVVKGSRLMFRRLADKSQQRDIDDYLLKLHGMDGSEIGGVVALAAHMRNRVFDEKELDFLLPDSVTAANSSIVITLVKTAKRNHGVRFV